jgi:nicotinate-nucleotide adenylyltransferase
MRLGILGGTLDPIHLGHLETARAARTALGLDRVLVIPAHVPPHRPIGPMASGHHRFAMAALAINDVDGLEVSELELDRAAPSYTADTLMRVRAATGLGATQIFFITGADAFAEIATWHRYPEVLDLSNFAVVSRPGYAVARLRASLPALAPRMTTATGGREGMTTPAIFLIDAATPDVSSTAIRRRLIAGESVAGLLPPAVASHIGRHGLYTGTSTLAAADHLHGEN